MTKSFGVKMARLSYENLRLTACAEAQKPFPVIFDSPVPAAKWGDGARRYYLISNHIPPDQGRCVE
jgi:hypothetical protein